MELGQVIFQLLHDARMDIVVVVTFVAVEPLRRRRIDRHSVSLLALRAFEVANVIPRGAF